LDICAGVPEFLVTPLQVGPVCLLSQGQFKEPVHSWVKVHQNITMIYLTRTATNHTKIRLVLSILAHQSAHYVTYY